MIFKIKTAFYKRMMKLLYWVKSIQNPWIAILMALAGTAVSYIFGGILLIPQMIEQLIRAKSKKKTSWSEVRLDDMNRATTELNKYEEELIIIYGEIK